jgi:hypothetical protein
MTSSSGPQTERGRTVMTKVTSASTEIAWNASERLASVRYTSGYTLTSKDGDFLAEALTLWIGASSWSIHKRRNSLDIRARS